MAKQTRIIIETDSLILVRGRNASRAWCPRCAAVVETVELEEVAVVSNLESTALEEWLNSGELHRLEGPGDLSLTCLNSLLALVQKTPARPEPEKEKK